MRRRSCAPLRGALWEGDSLACGPAPASRRAPAQTLALGVGRMSFGLWGARVPDEFPQELELGEEELPDDVPT